MKLLVTLFSISALLGVAALAASDVVREEIAWSKLAAAGRLKAGEVVASPGEAEVLKIAQTGPGVLQAALFAIEQPKITTAFYRVEGEIRYEGVESEPSYLEMWNYYPGGGAYFSRTMGEMGPMAKLHGTAGWRGFILPFNGTGANGRPTKLEINLHLAGKGTVYLRNVKLVQMDAWFGAPAPDAWWQDRTAGLVGGIGGAVVGCLGSALEYLATRGRARRFVVGAAKTLTAVGVLTLVSGGVALSFRQPYGVWYVLLLGGVLCAGIFPFRLRRYEARYRELELRRMTALDAA